MRMKEDVRPAYMVFKHFVIQAEPFASFDSVYQSRQHAVSPDRWVPPRLLSMGSLPLLRRFRHCRGFVFHPFRHFHIHLPTRLRSAPVTRFHRYYAGSDFPASLLRRRRDIPSSRTHVSGHPAANHPHANAAVFFYHLSFTRRSSSASTPPLPAGSFLHGRYRLHLRLVGSPTCQAESRSCPAGCPFSFRCSPPRLAATQLRLNTNLKGQV